MPIWSVAKVAQEPEMTIARWRVIETDAGTRHFVGMRMDEWTGRVSTGIVKFDPATARGTTQSGRVYQLHSTPGSHPDADEVWHLWKKVNSVTTEKDVSREVWDQMVAAGFYGDAETNASAEEDGDAGRVGSATASGEGKRA